MVRRAHHERTNVTAAPQALPRFRSTRTARLASFVLAFVVLLAGCAAPFGPASQSEGEAQRPTARKRVSAAIRGDPVTLSATVNSAGPGGVAGVSELEEMVHVGLAEVQRRTVFGPRLAEAVPSVENGLWKLFPDGRMETTWTLKPNLRWHDGTPLTTEDLMFAVRVGQDRELGLLGHQGFNFVEGVEAVDARTVTVKWRKPFIEADTMFSGSFALPLPRHLLEKALDDKTAFFQLPLWTKEFVGAGPFKLREWVDNSHLVLAAFEGYALGRPKIDEVEVRFILDPNVMIANALAGTIDVTLGRGLSFEQAMQAREQWREGKIDLSFAGTSWIALFPQFINPNPPVLADVRFRRALLQATDRQRLVDTFMGGLTQVAHSYVGPSQREYREVESAIVRHEYDARTAVQVIEGLGYIRGADGFFRDAANQRLSVEIRTTAGDDLRDKLLFAIADEWQRSGVGVEPIVIPRQRADDREYRATRPAFELVRQPNDLSEGALMRLHGSEAALPANNYRGGNRIRYMNPELDALIERYLVTIPIPERMQVVRQMVQHISDQLPILGILYDTQPMLIANRLANVNADQDTRNSHEWDVR